MTDYLKKAAEVAAAKAEAATADNPITWRDAERAYGRAIKTYTNGGPVFCDCGEGDDHRWSQMEPWHRAFALKLYEAALFGTGPLSSISDLGHDDQRHLTIGGRWPLQLLADHVRSHMEVGDPTSKETCPKCPGHEDFAWARAWARRGSMELEIVQYHLARLGTTPRILEAFTQRVTRWRISASDVARYAERQRKIEIHEKRMRQHERGEPMDPLPT